MADFTDNLICDIAYISYRSFYFLGSDWNVFIFMIESLNIHLISLILPKGWF